MLLHKYANHYRRWRTGRDPRTQDRGFTLLELLIVLILLGLIFTFVVPSLNGVTPRYRMRSFARKIGGVIEQMRVVSIVRGRLTGIRYYLGDEQYVQSVPPATPEYPDEPLHERKSILKHEVPDGVRIQYVRLPGGQDISDGFINIGFAANGTTGSHIVHLQAESGMDILTLIMKYNSITGILDYYNHEVDFLHEDS